MQGSFLERLDRETRTLVLVAIAALVFVIAAVFALSSSTRVARPAFEPVPFFPALAQQIGDASELMLETKDEKLRIARNENGQWVLPDKDNYPVRLEPLREILLGLGELLRVQPATANPEWHQELRLVAPDQGGEATRVTLKGASGSELVSLLVGEQADLPDITGLDSWYVRVPGDSRSWLARGTLSLRLDPAAWIVTDVLQLPAEKIRSATITPPEGSAYTVARDEEKAANFTLRTVPADMVARGPAAADGVARAIADLQVRDARLASDFDFRNAPTAQYRTFDGLEITVRTLELGEDVWATIEARFDGQPGGDAAQSFDSSSLAADINARVAGWAFLLPAHAGRQMRLPLSELVEPVPSAAPAPAAAPGNKSAEPDTVQVEAEKPAAPSDDAGGTEPAPAGTAEPAGGGSEGEGNGEG